MNHDEGQERLTEIGTLWTVVRQAQMGSTAEASAAQEQLWQRYGASVRRYLHAALGNAAAADDLMQEFALALVQSKFRKADPKVGRFRDYVKGVLFNLIQQYRRRQYRRATPLDAQEKLLEPTSYATECDQQFRQSWRDELLARSWAALAEAQPTFFTVLHFRAAHPDMSFEQMLQELGPQLGKDVNAASVRQTLHRARKLFADLLLAEVAPSLDRPSVADLQEELAELDLLPYFKAARAESARE